MSHSVPFVDPFELTRGAPIDLLKVDIEGAEYDFLKAHAAELSRVRVKFLELHQNTAGAHSQLLDLLDNCGLASIGEPITSNGQELMVFQ